MVMSDDALGLGRYAPDAVPALSRRSARARSDRFP
jgi:hypothetical protein